MDKKYTVLVVDDVPANLQIVGTFLSQANYNVFMAMSGKQALEILLQKEVDLVLLDVSMPEMDGFETCRTMKKFPKFANIPVIFLTARSETGDVVKGFEVGGIDYITKPIISEILLQRVRTHLKTKQQFDVIVKQNEKLSNYNSKIKELASELEIKNNDLIASIKYAKYIQKSAMPNEQIISQFVPDNFIIYMPKDIVSGDFYWIKQVNNQVFIAAVDCTGHGVPGALLSMLGVTYLNEIVENNPRTHPLKASEVLNKLRERIKVTFNQEEDARGSKDGMDIALCIIDIDNRKMQYAGAHNPLYIIRNDYLSDSYNLIEYKADKMPISAYFKEKPFQNHEITIEGNDQMYIFSDGYVDQFGGKMGLKFMARNFKELLLKNAGKSLKMQKQILLDKFNEWKGTYPQIDDILIIGFKISQTFGDDIEMF